MANSLTTNPIVLTTTMASAYKASVASALGTLLTLWVEKIVWVKAVTAGDEMKIVDPVSNEVLADMINTVANSTNELDWTAHPKLWQDFKLTTLTSGTLYIYCR